TYMLTFYKDDTRPLGVNNRTFDKVGMPHVMLELQGLQECAPGPVYDHGKPKRDPISGDMLMDDPCGALAVGDVKGSMNAEEYEKAVYDLVNFMEYLAEPAALERQRIGVYVLLFILVFGLFSYLLARDYWRDIH
ncbi:MAG: ubiquinol-cytochrome c reductase, partial [Cellvibrionaceae bacterium]|nr:ubiquinol-cytochrome c reductase [Cellvibrionaceae bacterium]